jgi:hypothetical protein
LKILGNFDFWLRGDMRISAPDWWRWGAYRIFGDFFAWCVFLLRRGGVGFLWRGFGCGIWRLICD